MADLATRKAPETRREPIMRDGRELTARNDIRFLPQTYNEATREIDVSLGTGADVERYDWDRGKWFIERLSMDPSAIRLERMNSGAPFLEDHRQYDINATRGVWVQGTVKTDGRELAGRVKLSRSNRASDTVTDILDGILSSTSVGYMVHAWEITNENGVEIRTATDWEPIEGSIVGIPADITGGVRGADDAAPANTEENRMDEPKTDPVVEPDPAPATEAAPVAEPERALDIEREKAAAAERAVAEYEARCQEIRKTGRTFGLPEVDIDAVVANRGLAVTDAVRALQEIRAKKDEMDTNQNRIQIGTDETDKKRGLMQDAMMQRAHVGKGTNPDAMREYGSLSLVEMVRDFLGSEARGLSRGDLFARMATSDFPLLLANLANKVKMERTEQSAEYRWFERVFTRGDYTDFRAHAEPNLEAASSMPQVLEGDDYTLGTMSERSESSTALQYGRDFKFTKQMFYNDDLEAFADGPALMTEAAWRKMSDLCASLLSSNQTMGDGVALFHTVTHANLSTSSGVPTATRINELEQFLLNATRTTPDGTERIGAPGKYLLIPASLKPTIKQLFEPIARPDYTTEMVAVGIEPENRIVVPSFTGGAYYMTTGRYKAARYGYLRDEGGIVISQYVKPEADALVFHGGVAFGCHINKWQDWSKNAG
jgi:hypothetical protein